MIALSVELPQTGPEIAAHLLGGRSYGHQVLIREDGAALSIHCPDIRPYPLQSD